MHRDMKPAVAVAEVLPSETFSARTSGWSESPPSVDWDRLGQVVGRRARGTARAAQRRRC